MTQDEDKEFAKWLVDSMARLHWTRTDLAERTGSSMRTVRCWRSGQYLTERLKSSIRALVEKAIDAIPSDTLAQWIHDEMFRNGWNEPMLAEYMGVSQQTISNWVLGRYIPSAKRIDELRTLFDDGNVSRPPIQFDHTDCNGCDVRVECAIRVGNGLSMMCEGFTEEELAVFEFQGRKEQMVWWEPINPVAANQ